MRSFVTGEPAKVGAVIDNIFNRNTASRRRSPDLKDIHDQAVIVDPGGYIRGYYDLRDEEDVKRCLKEIGLVVNRGF